MRSWWVRNCAMEPAWLLVVLLVVILAGLSIPLIVGAVK